MLHTPKEKLALYIGTNYRDDACQKWLSEKQLVLQEPTYPEAVLARHKLHVQAVNDRVTKMVTSLEKQLNVIEGKLLLILNDLNHLKSHMEVDNKFELAKFELTDVVEVKTTANESTAFINAGVPTVREWITWLGAEGRCTPRCSVNVQQFCSTR
jgi:hypothetical protein